MTSSTAHYMPNSALSLSPTVHHMHQELFPATLYTTQIPASLQQLSNYRERGEAEKKLISFSFSLHSLLSDVFGKQGNASHSHSIRSFCEEICLTQENFNIGLSVAEIILGKVNFWSRKSQFISILIFYAAMRLILARIATQHKQHFAILLETLNLNSVTSVTKNRVRSGNRKGIFRSRISSCSLMAQ